MGNSHLLIDVCMTNYKNCFSQMKQHMHMNNICLYSKVCYEGGGGQFPMETRYACAPPPIPKIWASCPPPPQYIIIQNKTNKIGLYLQERAANSCGKQLSFYSQINHKALILIMTHFTGFWCSIVNVYGHSIIPELNKLMSTMITYIICGFYHWKQLLMFLPDGLHSYTRLFCKRLL